MVHIRRVGHSGSRRVQCNARTIHAQRRRFFACLFGDRQSQFHEHTSFSHTDTKSQRQRRLSHDSSRQQSRFSPFASSFSRAGTRVGKHAQNSLY